MNKEALLEKARLLTKEDRKALAISIVESIESDAMDYKDRFDMLIAKAELATGHELLKSKDMYSTMIRRFVAYQMKSEGYTWSCIARLFKRSHSTIILLYRSMEDILSLPQVYKEVIEQFNDFKSYVEEFDNG